MNHTFTNALFAVKKCVKSIQLIQSYLKLKASTQQINSSTRSSQGAENIGSDQHFCLNSSKTYWTMSVHSRARALQGLRASLKGLACLVASVIGIAMTMPMAVAPAAQIVPIKSYAKSNTSNAKEWACLSKLWGKESAWNHLADNPHSTAYGIPQILGLTTNNPYKQVDLGIKYIKHRYNTPCKAWSFHKKKGWY